MTCSLGATLQSRQWTPLTGRALSAMIGLLRLPTWMSKPSMAWWWLQNLAASWSQCGLLSQYDFIVKPNAFGNEFVLCTAAACIYK